MKYFQAGDLRVSIRMTPAGKIIKSITYLSPNQPSIIHYSLSKSEPARRLSSMLRMKLSTKRIAWSRKLMSLDFSSKSTLKN